MGVRVCAVSFINTRGIRHTVEVEAESLYEAVVLAVRRFRNEPWVEPVGDATVLEVDVREPSTKPTLSLNHVERWLSGATANPSEASRKARLKMMLVQAKY